MNKKHGVDNSAFGESQWCFTNVIDWIYFGTSLNN